MFDRNAERVPKSRSARLLQQLVRRQLVTGDVLSRFLGISQPRLLEYLTGEKRMPLDSQRRLAELILKRAPDLAQEARRLQTQCDAEERFHSGETAKHMIAPPDRFR